jgi:hypothetical protein
MQAITYETQRIGVIDDGIDGSDEYLLVTSDDDSATAQDVETEFLNRYYRDTNRAGGYFCAAVTVQKKSYSDNEFIVIIHHRYDV